MRKILNIFILIIIIIGMGISYVNADNKKLSGNYNDTYTIELKNVRNKKNTDFDIYILLPKKYILFAIQNDNIEYDGADTLIKNNIPSINVRTENVRKDLYIEKGVEYVQVLLEKNSEGNYEFDILSDYTDMDMKFRVKNFQKDYIMHIDNFEIRKGKCEIEYNYDADIVKQPDIKVIPVATKVLIVILLITVIVGIIAYIKQRR